MSNSIHIILLATAFLAAANTNVFAADDQDSGSSSNQVTQSTPAPSPSAAPSGSEQTENNRQRALEGSKSPFSFQLNLTYSGSSINHPFSDEAPNPGNQVPAPKVSLSGQISGRYRIDSTTTVGLGTGITTYEPFNTWPFSSDANTSVANPYVDLAHSYKLFEKIHNRADIQLTGWTDNQYSSELGYLIGMTVLNEAYYTFPFGLTTGLILQFDWNFFKGQANYDTTQQTQYDLYTDPYFEYVLTKRINLRSVIGIQALGHNMDMHTPFAQYHQKIYQTFGVGVSVMEGWFIYPYLQAPNYTDMGTGTVIFGFNTIVDLF